MRSTDPTFKFILKMFGQRQVITVPRALVILLGDFKAAILLSQIIYWSEKLPDEEDWFYKTAEEWEEEIVLSRHEVDRATDQLESFGLIETKLKQVNGIPKKHYKLLISAFREWICEKGEVDLRKRGSPGFVKKGKSSFSASITTEDYLQKRQIDYPTDSQETKELEPSQAEVAAHVTAKHTAPAPPTRGADSIATPPPAASSSPDDRLGRLDRRRLGMGVAESCHGEGRRSGTPERGPLDRNNPDETYPDAGILSSEAFDTLDNYEPDALPGSDSPEAAPSTDEATVSRESPREQPSTFTPINPAKVTTYICQRLKDAGLKKIGTPIRREIGNLLVRLEDFACEEIVLVAVEIFVKDPFWLKARNPLAVFLAFFKAYVKEASDGVGKKPMARLVPEPRVESAPIPQRAVGPLIAELPSYAQRWNAAMGDSLKVRDWNDYSPKRELAKAETAEEFKRDFDLILSRCQKVIAVNEYQQINDFNWLFLEPKGKVNWYRILHGEFAWAEKPKANGGQQKTFAQEMEAKTKGALERVLAQQAAEKAAKENISK